MEDKVALFKAKKVYKVVSVIQPPFMQWNETKSINYYYIHFMNHSVLTIVFLGTYEGYTFDLMEEIKKILE